MLNCDYLERVMEWFLHHFLGMIFQEKCFLCCILLTDQISLPLLLEILSNMCIVIICFPRCDAMNFEINLISLIKPFFYVTKKSRQKLIYLENKKNLRYLKAFFIFLKGF